MIIITSFNTLILLALQLLICYFCFHIKENKNIQTIVISTILAKLLSYVTHKVLYSIFGFIGLTSLPFFTGLVSIGIYIFIAFILSFVYKIYGYNELNRKSLVIAIINTIILSIF